MSESITCIPNDVLQKTCGAGFNAIQLSIILVSCRVTYGDFEDTPSLSAEFISDVTNLDIRSIKREIKNLISRNVILVADKTTIWVNSNTEDWIMEDLSKEKYTAIFNHWNRQGITNHRKITPDMTKEIDKALKQYTLENILDAISRYSKIYHDKDYFFSYNWTLINFLKQKNALPDFLDDGQKWLSYKNATTTKEIDKPKTDLDVYEYSPSWREEELPL